MKWARQLKKQKISSVGTNSSIPLPQTEVHEELSEPDKPLMRKYKISRGKKIVETTSQHSTSQLQTPVFQNQTMDDTKLSFWNPKFPHSSHGRKHNYLRQDAFAL